MRTKTFVWLTLCFITAFSVGLMVLAIFFYDNQQFDKSNDFEDDSLKMITKSENSFVLFYSLEDPNFGFQNSWQSFRMKIQDWNKTNIVYVGKIECSVFRSTCLSFKVNRYPTIAWIKNGKVVEEYVGDDISESIKKFFDKLVTIVTEQKPTTVQGETSSGNILKGGSFDIIRRFIEGERGQHEVSTLSVKTTEATTTVINENFSRTTETSHQNSSNASTTQSYETFKTTKEIDNSTTVSNINNGEQIFVSTTDRTNTTEIIKESTKLSNTTTKTSQEPVETTTLEIPKIPDETFTSSLLIPIFTPTDYENQIENSTSPKVETTTVAESSSESIIMTRPTETQSSEQKSSKDNVESNKNESYEDESPEDDDPFGLGGLFGNNNGNKAEYEEDSEGDENNGPKIEDVKESKETLKSQKESSETEEKLSTKLDSKKNKTTKSKEEPKTTKFVSDSEEHKKTSESKVRNDQSTEAESTIKRSHYSKEMPVSEEKSKITKFKSEIKEDKQKSVKESRSGNNRKSEEESTTKKNQSSKEEEDCKNNRCKKNKSENKEHKTHSESSKFK